MSWLFSQALVEAYSAENCLDGEPFAQLNVMPTQHKFWRNDKTMEFLKLSQFGLTLRLLTEKDGEALLTSFLAGFPVKTLVPQEKVPASQESAAACGVKWHGLLATLDRDTFLWKTAQCSLLEDLASSLETWPKWGMTRNGVAYLRQKLEPTINASASGYSPVTAETPSGNWPTPTCSEVMTDKLKSTQQKPNSMHSVTLPQAVKMFPTPAASDGQRGGVMTGNMTGQSLTQVINSEKMWPTPTKRSPRDCASERKRHTPALESAVMMLYPTPLARMHKECAAPAEYQRNEPTLATHAGGTLNPTWVEWLMGWPLGWTDLKALVTDKCHCAQQQHSSCLEVD